MRRRLMILCICLNFILLIFLSRQWIPAALLLAGTLILLREDRVLLFVVIILIVCSLSARNLMPAGHISVIGTLETEGNHILLKEKGSFRKYWIIGIEKDFVDGRTYGLSGYRSKVKGGERTEAGAAGVFGTIRVEHCELMGESKSLRSRMMEVISRRIDQRFGEGGPIVLAMIFGQRDAMADTMGTAFKVFGLSHLLVVSGFHIGIISNSYESLFRKLRFPYAMRKSLVWLILGMLAYLSGFGVSVMRAVGQHAFKDLSGVVERRYDSVSALSAISVMFLVINPYLVFSFSYRLSFLASFMLGWKRDWPVIVAVYLGVFPMILTFSSDFNLLTIPVNLIMIACVATLLPLAMLLLSLPVKMPIICSLTGMLFRGIGEILIRLSSIEWLDLRLMMPDRIHLTVYYGLLFLSAVLSENRWIAMEHTAVKKIMLLFSMIALMGLNGAYRCFFDESVLFIDVGSGDSALISHRGGHLLIDAGSYRQADNWLRRLNVTEVEGGFISHGHYDHYGGLRFMKEILFHRLFINEIDVLNDVEVLYNHRESLHRGTVLQFGDIRITALWPEHDDLSPDPNDCSQVLRIEFRGLAMLFTGDMTESVERMLTFNEVDILKAAHHGADTSSSFRSLRQLSPALVIVSVGADDPYGHPAATVVERLEAISRQVLMTKDTGSILVKFDRNLIRYKLLKE